MANETAILIWLPIGEVPQAPSFEAAGATTSPSFKDALVSAYRNGPGRPEQPWISTSDAIFGPQEIRVLLETLIDDESQ